MLSLQLVRVVVDNMPKPHKTIAAKSPLVNFLEILIIFFFFIFWIGVYVQYGTIFRTSLVNYFFCLGFS